MRSVVKSSSAWALAFLLALLLAVGISPACAEDPPIQSQPSTGSASNPTSESSGISTTPLNLSLTLKKLNDWQLMKAGALNENSQTTKNEIDSAKQSDSDASTQSQAESQSIRQDQQISSQASEKADASLTSSSSSIGKAVDESKQGAVITDKEVAALKSEASMWKGIGIGSAVVTIALLIKVGGHAAGWWP